MGHRVWGRQRLGGGAVQAAGGRRLSARRRREKPGEEWEAQWEGKGLRRPWGPGGVQGAAGGKGGRRGTERAVERGELATYINLYSCLFPRDRREESGGDPRERGGGGGVEGAAGWGAHGAHAGPYAKVLIIIQFATLVGELRVRDAIHWLFPGDYSGCEQLVFRPVVLHAVGNPL